MGKEDLHLLVNVMRYPVNPLGKVAPVLAGESQRTNAFMWTLNICARLLKWWTNWSYEMKRFVLQLRYEQLSDRVNHPKSGGCSRLSNDLILDQQCPRLKRSLVIYKFMNLLVDQLCMGQIRYLVTKNGSHYVGEYYKVKLLSTLINVILVPYGNQV
nr:hypothetical protein MACL_00003164 [Theileria orientalis]